MKIKISWNLKLLYKSDTDPQIEADLKNIEKACADFEKKYKNKAFTSTPKRLAQALEDGEQLSLAFNGSKPWWYFALKTDLDSEDRKAKAMATKYEQRMTDATNRIEFFDLEIAKVSRADQKEYLEHPTLAPYAYSLARIFRRAKFNLPEGEEQLYNLLSQTSYTMWVDAQEQLLNQQMIPHKAGSIPISEAFAKLSDLPKKERKELSDKITGTLKSISYLAEAELNAVYNTKKIMDARRGFDKPYSATIMGYENDEKSIETFVSLISKKFTIAHRFYALHAKLLGDKKITYAARCAKMGEIKTTFDFDTCVSMLRTALGTIDAEYVGMFETYLANGQIDVYPRKGKKGGAYCWSMGTLPTFMLLNHVNTVRSLETLAHEMGHAIHTELSKRQPPRYRKYSTATAEVASTFFELVISEEIAKRLSDKEKIVLLHNKIMGDISTIFRQVACFNFELDLHENIRKSGQVSKEAIAGLMSKHLKSYLGPRVEVTSDDGYFYVAWSHIRRFFYVYTYAYGQIISRALYEKWKHDPAYAGKIKEFLSAGRSMSPEDIFKSIDIDTSKSDFFEAGLKGIEKDIDLLEKLSKK